MRKVPRAKPGTDERAVARTPRGFTAGFIIDQLVHALGAVGVDVARACRDLEIDRQELGRLGTVVSRTKTLALFRAGLEQTGDQQLGIHLAQHMGPVGILGYLCRASESVREGLEALVRFMGLASSATRASLDSKSLPPRLTIETDAPAGDLIGRHILENVAALFVILLRDVTGGSPAVSEVQFPHALPGNLREYQRVLGCDVRFDQPRCVILLQPSILTLRSRLASPALERHLHKTVEDLAGEGAGGAISQRVSATIHQRLWAGEPATNGRVAKALGLSVRSLQRELQAEGVSLRELRRDTQLAVAQEILASSDVTVKEIALRAGFAGTATFDRAFKARRGMSPRQFRKLVLDGGQSILTSDGTVVGSTGTLEAGREPEYERRTTRTAGPRRSAAPRRASPGRRGADRAR